MKTIFGYSYYSEIDLAFQICEVAFKNKVDKGGNPYINHVRGVYNRLKDKGYRNEILVVGILHDLLEDCPEWTAEMLSIFFRPCIVESVLALTRQPKQTNAEYLNQLIYDRWAVRVKQADLEDNMNITRLNGITEQDRIRLLRYKEMHKTISQLIKSQDTIKAII